MQEPVVFTMVKRTVLSHHVSGRHCQAIRFLFFLVSCITACLVSQNNEIQTVSVSVSGLPSGELLIIRRGGLAVHHAV